MQVELKSINGTTYCCFYVFIYLFVCFGAVAALLRHHWDHYAAGLHAHCSALLCSVNSTLLLLAGESLGRKTDVQSVCACVAELPVTHST